MSRTAVARALSTELSWRILEHLVPGPRTRKEIAAALSLPDRVVSDHLEELLEAGMVNSIAPSKGGPDEVLFEVSPTQKSVGFPPRGYHLLSEALISSLVSSLGEDGARAVLKDMGLHIGESFGSMMASTAHPSKWGPEAYADNVVNRFLKDMQTFPRIVSTSATSLVYETRNCLFQELAVKYPGLVCDVLDQAVHEGIDKKMGATCERLKCIGHGDRACRYKLTWSSDRTSAGKRT